MRNRRLVENLNEFHKEWRLVLLLICVDVDSLVRFLLVHPDVWNRCFQEMTSSKK